ncbi:MAG: hypothetical protein BM556_06965 [Bacteriovorax sp. MedPE-SWde]|nr:MAG: hypothetical protein BM556_06965 [Bacteriovorax sp. MedPE-SWde]
MSSFGKTLGSVRIKCGHKSAKSFYNYLSERGLECNYQYYMKIEKDQAFPSSVVVNQIAKAIGSELSQNLIMNYCSNQFQSYEYLFKESVVSIDNSIDQTSSEVTIAQGQRELNKREISVLADKQENYFLFLLLTLSRGSVHIKDISSYHGLKESLDDLIDCGVAIRDGEYVSSTTSEFRFPITKDTFINRAYCLFDEWDIEFSNQFDFESLINKMMIRRISPRYLNAIKKQIDTISDFVRLSDEADQKHNNDVLHLQIQLSRGEIPG